MFKRLMCISAIMPVLCFADNTTYGGFTDEKNNPVPFQKIDSVVGIGASYVTGSIYGNNYTTNGLALSATKLFDSNVWLNFNAASAYQTSLINGNQNFLNGDVGYAFNVGDRFQVIPNLQIQRMQVGGGSSTGTANAVITSELADVHFELVANKHLLLFADAGYGPGQYNVSGSGFTNSSQNDTNVSSGGVTQINAGIAWKPLTTVPWGFKGQYLYQNYGQGNFGAVSGYILSTGIAF